MASREKFTVILCFQLWSVQTRIILEIALGFPEPTNIHEDLPKPIEWTVSYLCIGTPSLFNTVTILNASQVNDIRDKTRKTQPFDIV